MVLKAKIEAMSQINQLKVGGRIMKFPDQGIAEEPFKVSHPSGIEIYDIKSLDMEHKVIGLELAPESRIQFASPG